MGLTHLDTPHPKVYTVNMNKETRKKVSRLGGAASWSGKSKEEKSAEMSRRRKLGFEKQQARLKAIREGNF